MTFETGSATDLQDLLGKLNTFAVTTHGGWTAGYTPNPQTTDGWFELHKGSISFSAKFAVGAQAPPEHLSVHHANGYVNSTTAPGAHTNDSGNGYNTGTTGHTNANLLTERCVSQIGDGPYASYYFFADDTSPNDYIHVAVEVTPGQFRHFGFGLLSLFGDQGGTRSYCYGHHHDQTPTTTAMGVNHQTLLDGLGGTVDRLRAATIDLTGGSNATSRRRCGASRRPSPRRRC